MIRLYIYKVNIKKKITTFSKWKSAGPARPFSFPSSETNFSELLIFMLFLTFVCLYN